MKHTPGPWRALDDVDHIEIYAEKGGMVVPLNLGLTEKAIERVSANAVLIATSPELLTECDAMHAVLAELLQSNMHQQVCVSLAENGVELSEVYRTILKAKGK